MRTNQAGIDLIKSFESCKLEGYLDQVGVAPVGWGHTGDGIVEGMVISQLEADKFLTLDLSAVEKFINKFCTGNINENQFAALASFAFNLGCGSLQHSTLLKLVNENDPTASAEFLKWDHAGGVEVAGLTRRRLAEKELFNTPVGI